MPRRKLRIKGIVQGVGFRPFVYRLARSLNLKGFVRNTTNGVEIEIEGRQPDHARFVTMLYANAPPAARIDQIKIASLPTKDYKQFAIRDSKASKGFTQISPDIATCHDCLAEMNNPRDRRHRFPFINCTNCGPRYSIIRDTPYDRARTSMSVFGMCSMCASEFCSVEDRRFHAQPDCCSVCGPCYTLYSIDRRTIDSQHPLMKTASLLKQGKIIAIKGIGGFHIACDATNCATVKRLRSLKRRPTKPLAVMAAYKNLPRIVYLNRNEKNVIRSPIAPIMLLKKRRSQICEEVSPQNPYLGVMLPYTPVHHLLLEEIPYLIMTSANIQDEPIIKEGKEVAGTLGALVSFYLDHNRAIENRCDDSVGYDLPGKGFSIIRRSRGYVPIPVELPLLVKPTLAVGPYLKNTFTLADHREAYVSPHIGDLDNLKTLEFFREMIDKYRRWFRIEPHLIVHDLHPDYLSTKIAQEMPGIKVGVQHHIAHFLSCLGENKVTDRAIGVIFDGTGFGVDGKIWGGEFFAGDLHDQHRVGHLEYLPLPGGESSIKKPYRIAIAYARVLLDRNLRIGPTREIRIINRMIDEDRNLVYTSSMGRLFDCVSAMLGVTTEITYEAEAAISLEYIAAPTVREHYPYRITDAQPCVVGLRDTLSAILKDKKAQVSNRRISARFHNTVVEFSLDVVRRIREKSGIDQVCFSGGVFQNRYLLSLMIKRFEKNGFNVHVHRLLPNNDGCISYGQVIAGNNGRIKTG
jgi:hydrogenase maturation protein HypF